MKKTIFILSVSFLLYACGDKPENPTPEPPPYQLYTSLVVWHNWEGFTLWQGVVAYDSCDRWCKIDTLGTLNEGEYSKEVIIDTAKTRTVYIFCQNEGRTRLDTIISIQNNIQNIFEIPAWIKGFDVRYEDYPF
jgi:hypothetical protein